MAWVNATRISQIGDRHDSAGSYDPSRLGTVKLMKSGRAKAWKALELHGVLLASFITPKAIAELPHDRREQVLQRCR